MVSKSLHFLNFLYIYNGRCFLLLCQLLLLAPSRIVIHIDPRFYGGSLFYIHNYFCFEDKLSPNIFLVC